eukprot:11191132-Prorocentrum_lima.AAC.1
MLLFNLLLHLKLVLLVLVRMIHAPPPGVALGLQFMDDPNLSNTSNVYAHCPTQYAPSWKA